MEWERGNVARRFCPGYGAKILPFKGCLGVPCLLRCCGHFSSPEEGALVTMKGGDGKRV